MSNVPKTKGSAGTIRRSPLLSCHRRYSIICLLDSERGRVLV
ncbi:MAG: hypothetical protein AB4352_11245 [Hormoscilla sp.]